MNISNIAWSSQQGSMLVLWSAYDVKFDHNTACLFTNKQKPRYLKYLIFKRKYVKIVWFCWQQCKIFRTLVTFTRSYIIENRTSTSLHKLQETRVVIANHETFRTVKHQFDRSYSFHNVAANPLGLQWWTNMEEVGRQLLDLYPSTQPFLLCTH